MSNIVQRRRTYFRYQKYQALALLYAYDSCGLLFILYSPRDTRMYTPFSIFKKHMYIKEYYV